MDSIKNIWNRYKWVLNVLVTIAGLALELYGLSVSESVAIRFAFANLFICSVMIGGYSLFTGVTYSSLRRQMETRINDAEQKAAEMAQNLRLANDSLHASRKEGCDFARRCALFLKNVNRTMDDFRQKSMENNDEYLGAIEDMRNHARLTEKGNEDAFEELCKSQIIEQRKHYGKQVFQTYNRFVSRILSETVTGITGYLSHRQYGLKPAVTLKLLTESYCIGEGEDAIHPPGDVVFTAFRDKATYEHGNREIGKRKYHIFGNSDFLACLNNESYIRNNVRRGAEDYNNEHEDFDEYYDCALTVPIISGSGKERTLYGFYCCDALNRDSYPNGDIFDKTAAYMMYAAAIVIAFIMDQSELYWDELIDGSETFSEYVYNAIRPQTWR